jgi:phenylpropionate dioxygenase-like ring-hydroxylating dioxygenase large terminal subunit
MNEVSGVEGRTPVLIPTEAYTSAEYARAENHKLWARVWQVAGRVEELGAVGDYLTYEILDESIIVSRTAPDRIEAFYNVCQHRGRRLTQGCGHTKQFVCRFHGWRWHINGENAFILDRQDWGEVLDAENTRLKPVRVDTWGGWVWVCMDPEAESLADYLSPIADVLDVFELDRMRYRWRQWLRFPCNWKTAIESFNESYHVAATHPELTFGGAGTLMWSRSAGKHAWHGAAGPRTDDGRGTRLPRMDPRVTLGDLHAYLKAEVDATTTDTLVVAARRLIEELPAGSSYNEAYNHMMTTAKADDAARGVVWPTIEESARMRLGIDWHVFPNTVIIPGPTFALCYRMRPDGYDPDSCIMEVYVLERFPDGAEPKTEWVHVPDATEECWMRILSQDFANMPMVQKGIKSRGFSGARPSPIQEEPVIQFHRVLAQYMGAGAPRPIDVLT